MQADMTIERADRPLEIAVGWSLEKVICWCLVVALVFVMGADFRGDTGEEFQVHWQIYLRLLLAFLSGVAGTLMLSNSYKEFGTWPGLLLTAYVGWYAVTLPTSLDKGYSAAAWLSLLGVAIFIPGAMRTLGGFRFALAIASGLVLFLVGSWIAYLAFPEVGIFQEQVTETEVFERMGGLGHPNELGFYSAYTVLLFTGLGVSGRLSPTITALGIALGAVTLFGCFSRTAMLVCMVGLVFALQTQWRLRAHAFTGLVGIALAVVVTFVVLGSGQLDWAIQDALQGITKTGSTDELATATGRTEIWKFGMKKIAESPLYGYGYCSARFVMVDYSYHCHNIVLNAMMYGGLVSGFIVIAMILYQLHALVFHSVPLVDGLAAAMLTGGMVEGLLGAPSPAASIVIWIVILFWRQLEMQVHPTAAR